MLRLWRKYNETTSAGTDTYLDIIDQSANVIGGHQFTVTSSEDWTFYETVFAPETGDTGISFRFYIHDGPGEGNYIYLDNMQLSQSLVSDGGMEGTLTDNWTQEASATMASDTAEHSGAQEMKITAAADNVGASQTLTLLSGKHYMVSGWLRATSGDTASIWIDAGSGTALKKASETGTSYARHSFDILTTGTTVIIYLRADTNTDIVWFDDIAIEQLDKVAASVSTATVVASSFETGAYSDSDGALVINGTDTLSYPIDPVDDPDSVDADDLIGASKGTIAFWIKPDGWNGDDNAAHYFISIWEDGSNNILFYKNSSNDLVGVYEESGTTKTVTYAVTSANFAANTWYHLAMSYSVDKTLVLYLNGVVIGTPADMSSLSAITFSDGATIDIGQNNTSTYQPDAYFDDMYFANRVLNKGEIMRLHNLSRAVHWRELAR